MTPPGKRQNSDTLDLPSLNDQSLGLGPAGSAPLQLERDQLTSRGLSSF